MLKVKDGKFTTLLYSKKLLLTVVVVFLIILGGTFYLGAVATSSTSKIRSTGGTAVWVLIGGTSAAILLVLGLLGFWFFKSIVPLKTLNSKAPLGHLGTYSRSGPHTVSHPASENSKNWAILEYLETGAIGLTGVSAIIGLVITAVHSPCFKEYLGAHFYPSGDSLVGLQSRDSSEVDSIIGHYICGPKIIKESVDSIKKQIPSSMVEVKDPQEVLSVITNGIKKVVDEGLERILKNNEDLQNGKGGYCGWQSLEYTSPAIRSLLKGLVKELRRGEKSEIVNTVLKPESLEELRVYSESSLVQLMSSF